MSVTPGNFETPMGELEKEEAASFLKYNAIKRLGYLTGADIICDGGCIASGASAVSSMLHSS